MSKETKILIKDAKTAFQKKQFKEAEGICQVSYDFVFELCCSPRTPRYKCEHGKLCLFVRSMFLQDILKVDEQHSAACLLLGAIYQENDTAKVRHG